MRNYFSGCYFKCQSPESTIAVIPAKHETNRVKSSSVQLITSDGVWNIPFPYESFSQKGNSLEITVDDNTFSHREIQLNLHDKGLNAKGRIRFGRLTPIRYDIMGPFKCVPFLECRHSIYSMMHTVRGSLTINGKDYVFENGTGYIEGDRGRSFPKEYAWTQCSFGSDSLMLSVANIPVGSLHFTGIICVIYWKGKEYRLATYLGAKVQSIGNREIVIQQKDMVFRAKLIQKESFPLYAPSNGGMSRVIHESPVCRASYHFEKGGEVLFSFESCNAAFEYEYAK